LSAQPRGRILAVRSNKITTQGLLDNKHFPLEGTTKISMGSR
jgi:hypothetical protein